MEDTIEITTPSGIKVEVRNYTTHGDDKKATALLNQGMTVEAAGEEDARVIITGEATSASEAKYVELLVLSIDGKTENIPALLDDLRSADYDAIAKAVREIIKVPKSTKKS